MTIVLVDHNLEGQSDWLWGVLATRGWLDIYPMRRVPFKEAGLPINSDDRTVWRYAQTHEMLLLTANLNQKGSASLETTLREENTPRSLPILTLANLDRLREKQYREICAIRLVEIAIDIENYMGVGRLFIP
jgi:hypothetical protein